jgi:molybdopterin molybdotransferase
VKRAEGLGRVLAESLAATVDVPHADVSAMDGYALAGPPTPSAVWPVVGTVAAGDSPGFELASGAAVRIMTGAPVPPAADRVVPVELTDGGIEAVAVLREVADGAHIRRQAEVLRSGAPLLDLGTELTPAALALLATHGHETLLTHVRPTVSALTTGDEVVPPEFEPGPGKLRDSHTDFLLAAGRTLGLEVVSLGIAPDEPERLAELVRSGLQSDVLLIGGGVSMGEFDFVEDVLAELGCEVLFDHVSIQPGKPLVAARHDGGLVFGLPGNPASVMACFWLFVRPALRRLQGLEDRFWGGALRGTLAGPLPAAKDRDRFLPAEIVLEEGQVRVRPVPSRGSHDLAASAHGTALVRIRAGAQPAEAGAVCEILLLGDTPTA